MIKSYLNSTNFKEFFDYMCPQWFHSTPQRLQAPHYKILWSKLSRTAIIETEVVGTDLRLKQLWETVALTSSFSP